MIFKLLKDQYNILSSLEGMNDFISSPYEDNEYILFTVDSISDFQDQFFFNIVENGMDREGNVNDYGKQLYDIYDNILEQI